MTEILLDLKPDPLILFYCISVYNSLVNTKVNDANTDPVPCRGSNNISKTILIGIRSTCSLLVSSLACVKGFLIQILTLS